MCCDFAERLHNNAEMAGIRCAYVYVKLTGYTDPYNYGIPYSTSHACNAFETTDRGLVYIDDTGLVADEPHPDRAVKTVSIVIGQSYTPVSLFHEADWEDSYNSMGTVTGLQVIWDGSWNNQLEEHDHVQDEVVRSGNQTDARSNKDKAKVKM